MRTPTPWSLPTQPVTRALLLASGVSDAMIRTQLRSGALRQLRRGVVVASSAWPADPAAQHVMLAHAEQVATPGAVLSHASAGVVWGLPAPGFVPWHERPVSLTATGGWASGRDVDWHVAALQPSHVTRDDDGYAVTTVEKTGVDLAAGLDLPQSLVVLDAAARRLIASFVALPRREHFANDRLVQAAREKLVAVAPRRGRQSLLATVARVEPCRESAAESLTAGHIYGAGLPVPEFQAKIVTDAGTFYPDCLWREARLIGECDGAIKYHTPGAYVAEKEREQSLLDDSWRVVRWLAKEIMVRPQDVMGRIARALGC